MLASEPSVVCLSVCVCVCVNLSVSLYGALYSFVELVFFVSEFGVSIFLSQLGRLRGGGSSSETQDAASWLWKCFGCWCSFMRHYTIVFLLGFMCTLKSQITEVLCSYCVSSFLCTLLLFSLLSIFLFCLLARRELVRSRTVWTPLPSFSQRRCREAWFPLLTCM